MPETTPLIKAALNLRVGAGFDVYERSGRKEISTTNDIKSGDVYDSHYSGFFVSDGKYFLMRMNHDMAVTFDEIGADGISVDEDVVFE